MIITELLSREIIADVLVEMPDDQKVTIIVPRVYFSSVCSLFNRDRGIRERVNKIEVDETMAWHGQFPEWHIEKIA